jgi:hypothetical protein
MQRLERIYEWSCDNEGWAALVLVCCSMRFEVFLLLVSSWRSMLRNKSGVVSIFNRWVRFAFSGPLHGRSSDIRARYLRAGCRPPCLYCRPTVPGTPKDSYTRNTMEIQIDNTKSEI